jgi:Tfp pilus assembly protein FimT
MRYSVDEKDPGFRNYQESARWGRTKIFLDDVPQKYVVTADEEQGFIRRVQVYTFTDGKDLVRMADGEIVVNTFFGRVRVETEPRSTKE